jgi:hypothetical protein
MNLLKPLLAGLLLTGVTATVHADLTWDWSFTQTSDGGADYGSGTFTTGDSTIVSPVSGNTGYLVTGVTGLISGALVVSGPGTAGNTLFSGGLPIDNLLIPSGGGSAQVDANGLSFYGTYDGATLEYQFVNIGGTTHLAYSTGIFESDALTITEVAPEPSSILGAAAVLALLAAPRARKYLASRPTA